MRRLGVVVLVAAAALVVLPGAALAKGPSEASIDGPGLGQPLRVGGTGEMVQPRFGELLQHAGFSEGVWGPQAGVPAAGEPAGALGPRYTVTWTVPGPAGTDDLVRQDLYPYAEAGPLTHVAPGQPLFDGQRTVGGWFAGGEELATLLLDLGLREPAPPPPAGPDVLPLAGLGATILAAGCVAAWVAARARRRPAALPG